MLLSAIGLSFVAVADWAFCVLVRLRLVLTSLCCFWYVLIGLVEACSIGCGVGRRGLGWDGMGWDGMGWDGMGRAGMGWDGMGWAVMGWDVM